MSTDKKLNIDALLFVYLCLLAIAFLDHSVQCVNFLLLDNVINQIWRFIAAFIIFMALLFLCFKSGAINPHKQRFDIFDVPCLAAFLFFYIHKLPFPDTAYDTMAYEIFLGEGAFSDKLLDMKPSLPSFMGLFSLSQRVFYYFRFIFGYRLSTIINFLIVCISYYKAKEILLFLFSQTSRKLYKRINKHIAALLICGVAFASLYKEYIMLGETVTKADLFSIPLFLECILLLLTTQRTKAVYSYAGLLAGLLTAIKLTNMAFFLPVLFYLFIKNMKPKVFLRIFIFFIVPILPYVIYNVVITGNPIFPFFNKIFNSPYASFTNLKDFRWGPQTIVETILWPLVLILPPPRANFRTGILFRGLDNRLCRVIYCHFAAKKGVGLQKTCVRLFLFFIVNNFVGGYNRLWPLCHSIGTR